MAFPFEEYDFRMRSIGYLYVNSKTPELHIFSLTFLPMPGYVIMNFTRSAPRPCLEVWVRVTHGQVPTLWRTEELENAKTGNRIC